MKTIFLHELRFGRKSLLIWLSVMLFLAAMGAAEYGVVTGDVSIAPMIASMPRVMATIFGVYGDIPIAGMAGYYACMFLWYCMIAYAHAAALGASILSKEEDGHTAEYLLTKPFSRGKIITAKLCAAAVFLAAMTALSWLVTVFALLPQSADRIMGIVTQTMSGMYLTQLLFLGFGLLCSVLFRTKQAAVRVAVLAVLVLYSAAVMVELFGVPAAAILTPFWYFSAPAVIRGGFPALYLIPTALLLSVCVWMTYRLYGKRDLYC